MSLKLNRVGEVVEVPWWQDKAVIMSILTTIGMIVAAWNAYWAKDHAEQAKNQTVVTTEKVEEVNKKADANHMKISEVQQDVKRIGMRPPVFDKPDK